MRVVHWCAASIWSNGTRSRARSGRAASSPRRPRCICPISRSPIPRTASRRASGSSSWAKATIDARCGWPSVRELRSMADTETKAKAEKPQAADKAARPERGDKAQQAQKGPKPEKGDKSGKGEAAPNDLGLIAGQKAVITKARKSIATFKVRDGQPIGCKVTLRKARMYEFVDRLINIALPRVRDFRGLSPKSFDGGGNYTIGIKEHIIFPEIDYDKVADVWGMDITVCTSAKSDNEARALLSAFNFPFRQ